MLACEKHTSENLRKIVVRSIPQDIVAVVPRGQAVSPPTVSTASAGRFLLPLGLFKWERFPSAGRDLQHFLQ